MTDKLENRESLEVDMAALSQENQALRTELDRLRNSLRWRGASIFVEAAGSPLNALAAPKKFWTFYQEFRATRLWRKCVLGLECGLPDDPLRTMSPDVDDIPLLRKLARTIFSSEGASLEAAPEPGQETSCVAAGVRRAAQLKTIAADGPEWFQQISEPVSRASVKTIVMALHASEPEVLNGYTRRSYELMNALRQGGWNVKAAIRGKKEQTTDEFSYSRIGIVDYASPRHDSYVATYAGLLYDFIREQRPALIHAASNHITGQAAAIAAARAKLPFIYEVRGLWEVTRASVEPSYQRALGFKAQRRLEIETARRADRLLVNGETIGAVFAEAGIEPDKIIVVPNGCDPEASGVDPGLLPQLKSLWGLDDRPVIGYVGSLTPYEGLNDVFAALADLKNLDFQMLIVGDGPARAQLEAEARRLGVSDRIRWAGRVNPEQARASYGLIDVAPLVRADSPVARLTPPLKPLDAMAAGAAIIVSDLPPLRAFAEGGRGLIVQPGDRLEISDALRSLITQDAERQVMSEAARQWVRANRQWKQVAATIAQAYESIIQ